MVSSFQPMSWLLPVLVLLMGVAQWVLPLRMRPGLWFAVTVPLGFEGSSSGARVLRGYRLGVLLGSGGALVLSGLALGMVNGALGVGAVLVQQGAGLAAFLLGRRRVLPHSVPGETSREAVLRGRDEGPAGGAVAQLGPFAVLAATALWVHSQQGSLAGRLVLEAKAPRSVGAVLLMAALSCALLAGIAWALRRGARRGVPLEGSHWDFRRVVEGVLLGTSYLVALQCAGSVLSGPGGPTGGFFNDDGPVPW